MAKARGARKGRTKRKEGKKMSEIEDGKVALGIIIGEAFPRCERKGGKLYPRLRLEMCDRKAVEIVAQYWNTSVWQPEGMDCKPTPENPQGRAYATSTTGRKAKQTIEKIPNTEIYKKAKKLPCF